MKSNHVLGESDKEPVGPGAITDSHARRGKEKGGVSGCGMFANSSQRRGRQDAPLMRSFTVRGSSRPSDRKRSKRRDRQEESEAVRSEAVASAIAEDGRSALDAYVRSLAE